jgi:hypothetical protein
MIGGTETRIGSGKQNTRRIVDELKKRGETGMAAQLCDSYELNGYDDWFLPSKDELDLMYKNLKQKGLGGFVNGWYWSSSEYNAYYAWFQYFDNGYQYDANEADADSVRAVRAF